MKSKTKLRRRKKKPETAADISNESKPTESETVRVVATRPGDGGFWSNNE